MRLLILGGTGEAAKLAQIVASIPGIETISSLAGRTREPSTPDGNFRIGGFGGMQGLANYLHEQQIDVLIDATHPFANQISWNAAEAAKKVNIPHLMLIRPPWQKKDGDDWIEVKTILEATRALETQGERVFLTVGRQEVAAFAHLEKLWFLMRMIDPPTSEAIVPPGKVLCDRGPFILENERQILLQNTIDTIVSKNSGGEATYPKIIAARELGVKVIMINRPPLPPVEQVPEIENAVQWLLNF